MYYIKERISTSYTFIVSISNLQKYRERDIKRRMKEMCMCIAFYGISYVLFLISIRQMIQTNEEEILLLFHE
jgi:hypothetical protein